MTTNYHTPMSVADQPISLTGLNTRFSDLDSGISGLVSSATTTISGTSGEALADRDACYIAADGKIYALDPDATPSAAGLIRGFVTSTVAAADLAVSLVIGGLLDGFTGLSAGQPVYVDTLAGAITQTKPTATLDGSQVAIIQMGFAVTADSVLIRPAPIQYVKRAALVDDETLEIEHYSDDGIYRRELFAYFSEISSQSSAASYSSGNVDDDLNLKIQSIATYTADQCTGGTPSASSAQGGFPASDSFDNDPETRWVSVDKSGTQWLEYDFGSNKTIRRYTMQTASAPAAGQVTAWVFEYYDGATWQTADTQTGLSWSSLEKKTFDITETYTAQRWRIRPTASGGTSYQIYEVEMLEVATFNDENERLSQTFALAAETDITSVNLWLKKVGSPTGTMTLRIETVSAGEPTGTLADVGASITVAESGLGTDYADVSFAFAATVTLAAGDYALVLSSSRSYDSSNYVSWGIDSSTPSYGSGEMFSYDGSSWNAETADGAFSVLEPPTVYSSRISVDHWTSTFADVVNRYGNTSAGDVSTKTTFKCVAAAGFDDITCIVMLP